MKCKAEKSNSENQANRTSAGENNRKVKGYTAVWGMPENTSVGRSHQGPFLRIPRKDKDRLRVQSSLLSEKDESHLVGAIDSGKD